MGAVLPCEGLWTGSEGRVDHSFFALGFQIAVSMLTYPFLLVGDLMAVNNCG